MEQYQRELFVDYARKIGMVIHWKYDLEGNAIIIDKQKVELFQKYIDLTNDSIKAKEELIDALKKERNAESLRSMVEKCRLVNEIADLKIKQVDLLVAQFAHSDYVVYYQGRFESKEEQLDRIIPEIKEKLPKYFDMIEQIMMDNNFELSAENAFLVNRMMDYKKGKLNADSDLSKVYSMIVNILGELE